ncbi:MAG: hypothetical protein JWM68_3676 [Verrucomicrobiales bacterium]|nr:hypothetical protein [Verrucomicrobiales bacterium]
MGLTGEESMYPPSYINNRSGGESMKVLRCVGPRLSQPQTPTKDLVVIAKERF